jgi:hypothetical protein
MISHWIDEIHATAGCVRDWVTETWELAWEYVGMAAAIAFLVLVAANPVLLLVI